MKNTKPTIKGPAVFAAVLAVVLIVSLAAVDAVAQQDNGDRAQTRTREQIRDNTQDPQGDALRERIQKRIQSEDGLQAQEREQLQKHLGECKQLGLDEETTAALFDEATPLKNQIRAQARVLAMVREGLPVEPVMQKLREGRQKGVSGEVLERVCAQMEQNVRTANRFMKRAHEDGVAPGSDEAERRRTREMAMHIWRGLNDEEMDQLRERARLRLRDGSCTTEELTAAAETATKLKEMGVERGRALRLAGDALQNGYNAQEMNQLRWMVMTAHMHGGPQDEVLDTLEKGIRSQYQLKQMVQQMWQHGWMGPADEHGGRGDHGSGDGATDSGPGGQGSGQGGHEQKGGQGGQGGGDNGGGGGGQ